MVDGDGDGGHEVDGDGDSDSGGDDKAWERNAVEGWRQRWRLTGKKGKTKKLLQTMMMLIIFLLGIVDISDVQMCWCSWYLMVSAPRVLRQASSSDFERIFFAASVTGESARKGR